MLRQGAQCSVLSDTPHVVHVVIFLRSDCLLSNKNMNMYKWNESLKQAQGDKGYKGTCGTACINRLAIIAPTVADLLNDPEFNNKLLDHMHEKHMPSEDITHFATLFNALESAIHESDHAQIPVWNQAPLLPDFIPASVITTDITNDRLFKNERDGTLILTLVMKRCCCKLQI